MGTVRGVFVVFLLVSTALMGQDPRTEWQANHITESTVDFFHPSSSKDLPFKASITFQGETEGDPKKYVFILRFYETMNVKFVNSVHETQSRYTIIYYLPYKDFDFYYDLYDRSWEMLRIRYFKNADWENLKVIQEKQ
ncbi:MAG: hypothetical protein AB3N16_12875 [Flavobacteriaceae bacterium]